LRTFKIHSKLNLLDMWVDILRNIYKKRKMHIQQSYVRCRSAGGGYRGPVLAYVGCRGPTLAYVGCGGPTLASVAVVGLRWATLAVVVGLR
jgi:hypothetical protein